LAANYTGLFRWRAERDQNGRLHLLNEDQLFRGRGWRSFTFNLDGTRFIAANIHSNAAFIFDRTFTNCLATLEPHVAPDSVAISPDGRWAATGSTTDRHVRVWNTTSNALQLELPTGPEPQAAFSPDGRWFASFGDTFTLLEVGSWTAAPPLPLPDNRPNLGAAAFSPDGRLLAIVCNLYTIQLIDLQNYRPLGLLRSPSPVVLHTIQFSPDGRQIAGAGTLGRLLLWDLHQLRSRLREYALDWDWPVGTAVVSGR
jgi:WD40 repeat protein